MGTPFTTFYTASAGHDKKTVTKLRSVKQMFKQEVEVVPVSSLSVKQFKNSLLLSNFC